MPTYSYACTACDHRFDTVQAFTDSSLTECPECSGRLRKLFSSVGIVFKGSGFYRTDSRAKPDGSSEGKSDDKQPAKSAKSSEKSTSDAGSAGSSSSSDSSKTGSAKSGSSNSGSSDKSGSSGSGSSSSSSSSSNAAAS